VLDIGAGTGRDAAGLAELGYLVTAVEPTAE
jgi:protein-L-isoaspartate O-methyltransferase